MDAWIRFPIYVAASYVVFGILLKLVLRLRDHDFLVRQIFAVGLVVIIGGMTFAKLGQNAGWPWWIYYTAPMLLTVLLPPIYFKMRGREVAEYLVLSVLSAPFIHIGFSFFVGWKDYMPFFEVPSLRQLIE